MKSNWRQFPVMFVVGCIDHAGAIEARPLAHNAPHSPQESRGTRWRWCVPRQEFADVFPGAGHLTVEEHFAVLDWLVRHSYTDDETMLELVEHRQRVESHR